MTQADRTTIVLPTPKSALLQHEGQPVPWVTRWSGEVCDDPLQVSLAPNGGLVLGFADGRENRDAYGMLWAREGITRAGTPQYSEVNTYRQRAAMTKRRCQICGSKINERPIRWLMSELSLNPLENGQAATTSPPTCSGCIPLALELCPHLSAHPWVILKVLAYEPWGVMGQAATLDEETGSIRSHNQVYASYENPPHKAGLVAKQLVVRLTKYVIEESGGSTWLESGE